ncbi:MAG: hypothetical protein K2R98_33285 [Gemmataceae bacterium]|nr:hypothetical protein [Gemmataceae bacterium]
MRKVMVAVLAILFVGVSFAAAQKEAKPAELIVGKWDSTDEKDPGQIEFNKDGTLVITLGKLTIKGKYKLAGDDTLDVEITPPMEDAKPIKQTLKFKVTKDSMETTDAKGKVSKFKRAK